MYIMYINPLEASTSHKQRVSLHPLNQHLTSYISSVSSRTEVLSQQIWYCRDLVAITDGVQKSKALLDRFSFETKPKERNFDFEERKRSLFKQPPLRMDDSTFGNLKGLVTNRLLSSGSLLNGLG